MLPSKYNGKKTPYENKDLYTLKIKSEWAMCSPTEILFVFSFAAMRCLLITMSDVKSALWKTEMYIESFT